MVAPKDIHLLIVEDNQDLLEVIAETFDILGFDVVTAVDGVNALEEISKKKFDIVLTDIRMPKINGVELIQKIRAAHATEPAIFVISGYTDTSEQDLYEMGIDGFFAKPFDASAVRKVLTASLVQKKERYKTKISAFIKREFKKSFKSLATAAEKNELKFGRLGFLMPLDTDSLHPGDFIKFHFDFRENSPFPFIEGVGQIAWTRSDNPNYPEGVGVLIRNLDSFSVDRFVDWVDAQNFVASIPSK